jgi:putative salt-induced outer membrane protein
MLLGRYCVAFVLTAFLPHTVLAADGKIPPRTWVAELAIGGSLATGNTERKALDFDGKARYRAGRIEDRYKLTAELGREDGVTTAQRWVAGYESNLDIQDGLYVLGFTQYEDDRFSGFQSEIEAGLGVGYRVLDTAAVTLSFDAGPGYRIGRVRAPTPDEKQLFVRGTALLDWQMSDSAKLSDELSISWDDERTKVENTLSVTSKLIGSLAARASVNVRHNTRPPPVAVRAAGSVKKTDTISKIALVYSF